MELPQFIKKNVFNNIDFLEENINIKHHMYTCFSSYDIDNFFFLSNDNKKTINSFIDYKLELYFNDKILNSNTIKIDEELIQFIVPCNIGLKENIFLSNEVILCISSSKLEQLLNRDDINDYLVNKKIILIDNLKLVDLNNLTFNNCNLYSFNSYNNFLIMVNHLLYLVDNSNMSLCDKKYYRYYIGKYTNIDINDMWALYESEDKLKKLALDIQKELDEKMLNKLTFNFNNLDNRSKLNELSLQEFSLEIFLNNFNNINEVGSLDILKKYYKLSKEEKEIIFSNDFILKHLYSLFDDNNFNIPYFEEIISYTLENDELINLYNNKEKCVKELDCKFFEDNFFKVLLKQDINVAFNILLDRNDKLKDFLCNINRYDFYNINYPLFVRLLKKIDKDNLECDFEFINTSLSREFQFKLLNEEFSNKLIVDIVNHCSREVQQYFYLNDIRFSYLFDRFDVVTLSNNGYLFQDAVLENQEFFDLFKSNSLVQSRLNINKLMEDNPRYYFEVMLDKYEDDLIKMFDSKTELFSVYKDLFEDINILNDIRFKDDKISFFFDFEIINEIKEYIYYDKNKSMKINDKEAFYNYLKKLSKLKLNELIVDRLFDDNIYNVLLNLKEMLRYHNNLSDDEYVLSDDKIKFYQTILDIDSMDSRKVLNVYEKFKGENNSFMLYKDLRDTKDISYDKINDKLLKVKDVYGLEDDLMSSRYGVSIYDYRDKDYVMLVRCLFGNYMEEVPNRRDCYTLLSNDNNYVIDDDCYIYGYDFFDKNRILHILEGDAYSGDIINSDLDVGSYWVNRIMTCDEIILNSDCYSEIQIINEISARNNDMFNSLVPNYLIVYDDISEKVIKEAKRLNLPIFIISKNLNTNKLKKVSFDELLDQYAKNHDMGLELIRRRKR